MRELIVIDYQTNREGEKPLKDVLKKFGCRVNGFQEKEYGLRVFIDVPHQINMADLERAITNLHGFTIH